MNEVESDMLNRAAPSLEVRCTTRGVLALRVGACEHDETVEMDGDWDGLDAGAAANLMPKESLSCDGPFVAASLGGRDRTCSTVPNSIPFKALLREDVNKCKLVYMQERAIELL
ncbi:MAG: hypothetical protein SGPRY_014282 [Prymnesium sp.]